MFSVLTFTKVFKIFFLKICFSPRTEASEVTVERLLNKFIPSQAQVKEVFNTIPQYAFQDIPEQPR